MEETHFPELPLHRLHRRSRQRSAPVPTSFPTPPNQFQSLNVDLLDAQSDRLHQTQTRTAKQRSDQVVDTIELCIEPGHLNGQHLTVEKYNGGKRLILRRRRNLAVNRTVRDKGPDLGSTHPGRMPFGVKQDKTAYPVNVGLFRADTVVLDPAALTNRSKKTWFFCLSHGDNPSLKLRRVKTHRIFMNQGVIQAREFYASILTCFITSKMTPNYS